MAKSTEQSSYKWIILLITSASAFTTPFDSSAVNIALPSISSSFRMDISFTAWVQTSYLLAMSASLIGAGRLGDLKGRKNIFILGVAIFTLGTVFAGFSNSGLQILLSRIVQGFGAAMSTNAVAILVDAFPERERGKALGINMMVTYAGLTAGPLFGGILIQSLGWRSVFALNVPLGALIIILSLKWLKPSSVGVSQTFDLFGAISFSACLVPFLTSLTLGGTLGWTSIQVIVLMAVAAVSLGLFLWNEALLSKYPMLDLSLFMNNRLFTAANFTALAYYISSTSTSFMISYYLQTILKLPPSQAGSILLVMPLMMALISPLSGWLSDRLGSFLMSALGMAIITLALISFSSLETNAPTQDVLARLFVAGVGTGIFSSPNSSAVMGSVPREKLGVASGTLGTMRFIGQAISMTLAGAMLGSSMKLTEMFVQAMHAVFILSAVVAGTGFLISIMRGNRR